MEILDYSFDKIKLLSENVSSEISSAVSGTDTAFAFLRNPLPHIQFVPFNQIFQVITLGGTNISQSSVSVNSDKHVNFSQPRTQTFGVIENVDKLFDIVLEVLDPTYSQIVLNFAYPIRPFITKSGLLDGVLSHSTKEHQFNGLIDYPVGETLSKMLEEKFQKHFKIICANDVVCLTMASINNSNNYEKHVSMVLGTGNNFGMFLDSNTIINLESGNFGNFEQTSSGAFIDSQSNNPGFQKFEKEVAGKYLYQHFNYYAKQKNLDITLEDSIQLNDLAISSGERAQLAKDILLRSAAFVAAMLSGIQTFKNQSLECVTEGSLFWNGYDYKTSVKSVLEELGKNESDINIIKVNQSSLVGAANLGTYTT